MDLFTLLRYQHQALYLDSNYHLTRGSMTRFTALASHLRPGRGTFTAVVDPARQSPTPIAQVMYPLGARGARILFLVPAAAAESTDLAELTDGLAWQAASWGALQLLAELPEDNPAFETFRRAGFAVYARQRIWKWPAGRESSKQPRCWKLATPVDEQAVRSLYQALVPPLVQSAEPFVTRRLPPLVYRQQGELVASIETYFGPRGIFLVPLVHPALENPAELLADLPNILQPILGRPIYLAVRSYQAWLENALEEQGATAAPEQALLVRHLAVSQRVAQLNPAYAGLKNHGAEPTTSIVQHIEGKEN